MNQIIGLCPFFQPLTAKGGVSLPVCSLSDVSTMWTLICAGNWCVQGQTPIDVCDPEVETLLEELKKQQELVSDADYSSFVLCGVPPTYQCC